MCKPVRRESSAGWSTPPDRLVPRSTSWRRTTSADVSRISAATRSRLSAPEASFPAWMLYTMTRAGPKSPAERVVAHAASATTSSKCVGLGTADRRFINEAAAGNRLHASLNRERLPGVSFDHGAFRHVAWADVPHE